MTHREETPHEVPDATAQLPEKYQWLLDRYEPTEDDKRSMEAVGLPSDADIIAGFLMHNPLIFGVPDRAELFRLDALRAEIEVSHLSGQLKREWLRLRIVTATPFTMHSFVLAHPPIVSSFSDVTEHNYTVAVQAVTTVMALTDVRVLHGSETDQSTELVFEGTEFPGPAYMCRIRVVRVTVHARGYATWETVSETKCAHS